MQSARMAAPILSKIGEKSIHKKDFVKLRKNKESSKPKQAKKNTYVALKLLLGDIQLMY